MIDDLAEALSFAAVLVGGSMAVIAVLYGLGALFFYLISIVTGVPMPPSGGI